MADTTIVDPVADTDAKNTQPFAQAANVNDVRPAKFGLLDYLDYMVGGAIVGLVVAKVSGVSGNVGLGVGAAAGFALGRNQQ